MNNITFNVDDDLYKKMKEHPEIKWAEILRQSILDYPDKVEERDIISINEFRKQLEPEILQKIKELDEKDRSYYGIGSITSNSGICLKILSWVQIFFILLFLRKERIVASLPPIPV